MEAQAGECIWISCKMRLLTTMKVTLNEANEVARRLAAMKSGSPVRDEEETSETSDEEDDTSYADEVATYMIQVKQSW